MAKKATAVLVLLPLLVMYTEAVLIPSLPTIQKDFDITPGDASWILSIYLLVGTISVAIMGKLGDMYGKRRMFLIALIFYAIGVTLNGFAPSFKFLLFSRGLQGIGMAIFPLGFSLVREEFPPKMVPQVQGLISSMFAVGMVIALPLGAFISQHYGWRATYNSIFPFAFLMLFISWLVLKESRYITPSKFDFIGSIFLILFIIPSLVAVTRAPIIGWMNEQTISLLLISTVSFLLLIIWEIHVSQPLIPLSIISSRNPFIANFGIMIAAFAIQMMSQANTYIFQMPSPYGFGKSILETGLFMTPNAIVMLIVAPIAGRLMIKMGAKFFAILGSSIAFIGLLFLSKYVGIITIPKFIGLSIIVSSGIILMNVSLINVLIFSVRREFMGVATGANSLFRNFGATWGPAIAGTIMNAYSIQILNSPYKFVVPQNKAYQLLFLLAAIIFFILLFLFIFIREVVKGLKG